MNKDNFDEMCAEYLPRVIRLAEYNIAPEFKRIFDADDIGGTVFRTVARRISEGKFDYADDESLWKQLVTITLRRISNKIRAAKALKRGGGKQVVSLEDLWAISKEPDPSHAVALVEVVGKIGDRLDEAGQRVLELRMAGFSNAEIATKLGYAERTVGRKIQLTKIILAELLEEESQVTQAG